MKTYKGQREGTDNYVGETIVSVVDSNGIQHQLTPERSLRLRNHSPTGFNWGYGGSGPSQLALALLLDLTNDEKIAQDRYIDFRNQYVSGWSDSWEITEQTINEWLNNVGTN